MESCCPGVGISRDQACLHQIYVQTCRRPRENKEKILKNATEPSLKLDIENKEKGFKKGQIK